MTTRFLRSRRADKGRMVGFKNAEFVLYPLSRRAFLTFCVQAIRENRSGAIFSPRSVMARAFCTVWFCPLMPARQSRKISLVLMSKRDRTHRPPSSVLEAMEGYEGPLIKILNFDIVSRSETWLETITYELWVTPYRSENGWGEFHKFRVTIKRRFLLPPRLVEVEYCGIEI